MPEPIETVDVAPSAENGNVSVEAPSEPTKPDGQPVADPVKPTESTETLYELPDGRKVNAETLSKEWKENFLPDYTRKSQELAKNKGKNQEPINKPMEKSPYEDPEYVPKNYEEIVKAAEERAVKRFEALQEERTAQREALETQVTEQVAALKKTDPSLDENKLFQHAVKYSFKDLNLAYENMKEMNLLAKNVQQNTVKNMAKKADPVSTTQSKAAGSKSNPRDFGNARDFLRSIK